MNEEIVFGLPQQDALVIHGGFTKYSGSRPWRFRKHAEALIRIAASRQPRSATDLRNLNDPVASFLSDATHASKWYDEIEIRSILLRQPGAEEWTLLGMLATATASPSTDEELPDGKLVAATVHRIPISKLDSLLVDLQQCKLEIPKRTIRILGDASDRKTLRLMPRRDERRLGRIMARHDWAAIVASGQIEIRQEFYPIMDDIVDELHSLPHPWNGIGDLRKNHLMKQNWGEGDDMLSAAVVQVPYPARLGEGTLVANNELRGELEFLPTRDGFECAVGVIAHRPKGPAVRQRMQVRAGRDSRRSFVVAMPPDVIRVDLLLTIAGQTADSWSWESFSAFGAPARFAALRSNERHDDVAKRLRSAERGRPLEIAVALAFHLSGFSPGIYGNQGSEADLVVFPDAGRFALVVECTTGGTDLHSKLQKLALRTQTLSKHVDGRVNGVLLCQQPADLRTASVRERAGADCLALLDPDGIISMVEQASRGASTADLRNFLATLVPDGGAGFRKFEAWGWGQPP
ncbi:MAG: hypothetical protein ACYDDF_05350 [Thermoplasmatota archaeon]